MKKITYLIGAGASANALPLIKKNQITKKPGLSDELKAFVDSNHTSIIGLNSGWTSESIISLAKIVEKCIEFGTPDLYAKYLLETGDTKNYQVLKSLLSAYFKFEQEFKGNFDFRALTFLATITENKKIPDNIKILSWNYDCQIEMAAEKLKPVNPSGYPKVQGFSCWPNINEGYKFTNEPFLFHLNGIAGFYYSERDFTERIEPQFHFKSTLDRENILSFAWENENNNSKKTFHDQRLLIAKSIADNTEILVVIGYSFPFFNRVIDKVIFDSLKNSVQKIYFQDPTSNGQQLIGLFGLLPRMQGNIIHVPQVDNYHIPFEL